VRGMGQALDATGVRIQGKNAYRERLAVHARVLAFPNQKPNTDEFDFIAPNASVIGNVTMARLSSVFYNAILRSDGVHNISVGEMSVIGDHAVVTATKNPTKIGNTVHIGAGSSLDSCTIENGVHISAGCVIGDGVVIEEGAVIGSGSVVPSGTRIPARQLWAGFPAAYVRDISSVESEQFLTAAGGYYWLSTIHAMNSEKSPKEVEEDRAAYEDEWERNEDYGSSILNYVEPEKMPRLDNYIYPLQLRTYFELDKVVEPRPDQVVWLNEDDDVKQIMEDTLVSQGVRTVDQIKEPKKSYWYVG